MPFGFVRLIFTMKTIEVISLLSSPPLVPAKSRDITRLSPAEAKPPQLVSTTTSKQHEGWFELSEDDDAPLPPAKPTSTEVVTKPRLTTQPNPWAVPVNDFGSDDFWSFGKDATDISKTSKQNILGEENPKASEDFFFLSDDFDSSVHLDNSYSLQTEPPAKKRKTSLEPEQKSLQPTTANSKGKGLARASSDLGAASKGYHPSVNTAKSSRLQRSRTTNMADDPIIFTSSPDIVRITKEKREKPWVGKERDLNDDPILFTSSPDIVRAARKRREKARRDRELESDDEGDDDPFTETTTAAYITTNIVESDAPMKRKAVYPDNPSSDIDLPDILTVAAQVSTSNVPRLSRKESDKILAKYNAEKATAQKGKSVSEKTVERGRKAQEKLESKEVEKERKRLAKEEKALEKQMATDIAKVNQKRTEKKISTPEMIVDLPMDLEKNVAQQVRRLLGPLGADCEEWHSSIPNVIRWRRKIQARYNDELGYWEPTAKHVKVERQVMCVMVAKEFVDLVCSEEGSDLDAHVLSMKTKYPGYSIIYLIEGLTIWQRKNKNIKNRQFTEAVRNQMNETMDAAPSSQRSKKKKKLPEYIDADIIEDALLSLQVLHGVLIHHTGAAAETAEWVVVFTQHISTAPYRYIHSRSLYQHPCP